MKKLTLITTLLLAFTVSALSQKKTEVDSRFACPNEKRDTLFVVDDMAVFMTNLWQQPSYDNERPVIIAVSTLAPYIKRFGLRLDLKARMK